MFELGNGIMDNPGDAKYGMSEDQMAEAYTRLMAVSYTHLDVYKRQEHQHRHHEL